MTFLIFKWHLYVDKTNVATKLLKRDKVSKIKTKNSSKLKVLNKNNKVTLIFFVIFCITQEF